MNTNTIACIAVLALGCAPTLWSQTATATKTDLPCPHVQESAAEQQKNLERNQALLRTLQEAARRCTGMAWQVRCSKDGKDVFLRYAFSDAETARAREIILNRAHAVKTDDTVQPCGAPRGTYTLCFRDAEGRDMATAEGSAFGLDSLTTPDGYLYNAAIAVPDADLHFLQSAGNAPKRDADVQSLLRDIPR